MLNDLRDAKRAFGLGLVFFGYAAIRLLEYAAKHDAWKKAYGKWIADNPEAVEAFRERIELEEGL